MKTYFLMFLALFAVNIHAEGGAEDSARQFNEAFSQILSIDDYQKIMFGSDIEKINRELDDLGKKSGKSNQKKIDRLNKKLGDFSAKAERDLKRRTDLVTAAAKSVTPGAKNSYAPLRNAVRENLDFLLNCQGKAVKQLEKKEKELAVKVGREKDKSSDKENTGLEEDLKACRDEIKQKEALCLKIREAQRKIADDNILEFLKTISLAAEAPQAQAQSQEQAQAQTD